MVEGAMLSLVGWIFTYLIHSAVLILGVWLLTRLIPRISLSTQETMWKVALFGGVLTSLVQVGFSVSPVTGHFGMPDAFTRVAETAPAASQEEISSSATTSEVSRRVVRHQNGDLTITTVREPKPRAAGAPAIPAGPREPSAWPWVVLGLVGAGSLFAVGRLMWVARKLRRQLDGRRDVIEDPVLETWLSLCQKAELKKRPRLSASSRLRSPVALMRNEICLPERAVDSLSPQQQEGMLAHELAHLLRRDPAWRIVTATFEAVFFFQPLNHLARRKLNEVAEFQCDEWAAQHTGSGVHLAKCLAEVAGWLEGGPTQGPLMTAMATSNSPVVQRITRLLGRRKSERPGYAVGRIAFTVFALGGVTWLVPGVAWGQGDGTGAPGSRSARDANAVLASGAGLRFSDDGNSRFDRSVVEIDSDGERVEVIVQSRKPAPPPPPPAPAPPAPPERDSLQIIIQGHHGWGWGFDCSGCGVGMGLFGLWGLDVLDEDDFEDLYELHTLGPCIEEEVFSSLGLGRVRGGRCDRSRRRGRHEVERARHEARRARERAERARHKARARAERAHEKAERARERALEAAERARELHREAYDDAREGDGLVEL